MLFDKQLSVREALCDSFNTPKAITELGELMTLTNTYMAQQTGLIKVPLVRQVSKFVFHIMKCFGIYEDGDFPAVVGTGEEGSGVSYEETITPLMNVLTKFRDEVKNKAGDGPKSLFQLCDELRDDILPYLGIQLEDKGKGEDSIWKHEDKEILLAQRQKKIDEKLKKEQEKQAKKELELKKKSTPGKEWFKVMESDKYSQFNEETGLPTHDSKGKALSEAIVNKLKKTQNTQQTKYEKWLKEQEEESKKEEEK